MLFFGSSLSPSYIMKYCRYMCIECSVVATVIDISIILLLAIATT